MRKSTAEKNLTFDAKASVRSFDENGFMRVKASHITKATVNPYYGREIPGWREAGLNPDAVYYGLRDPEELKASLETWAGLPLHIEHHIDSADEPAKLTRVGAVGAAVWNAPYVDAPLTVWDQAAIDAIKNGSFRELSCAYRYDPDFTPGIYEGIPYDFVMRDIRGNHVALVEEGRAGPDVVVADGAWGGTQDDRWITVKPNGANNTGRPALIDENGTVKAGMGGKFNGRNIDDIPRGKNPHPVSEERYQARQERLAKKSANNASSAGGGYASMSKTDLRAAVTRGVDKSTPDVEKLRIMRQNLAPIEAEAKRIQADLHWRQEEVWRLERESGQEKGNVKPWQDLGRTPKEKAYLEAKSALAAEKARTAEFLSSVESMNRTLRQVEQSLNPASTSTTSSKSTAPKKTGATYLNISYQEKDAAKRLGAKWDADRRQWYIPAGKDVPESLQGKISADKKVINLQPQGSIMKRIKKWFRGAQDDNPEIEKQEVELAQAIIDLHKVDPVTGEIVDITEDEDKAEEIRKIIGELSAKLEPEDVKRLTDSLTDLAYSKATGDEKKPGMDEEMKKAMDKCGLDAEDPAESRAFAEGVKYGEELERNPEERGRLDREHESEGMKKAMDSSGLDAENPQESKAFAEGVKYGEELIRNPEERRKLDREHESEGERRAFGKDEDKNAAIERILASVPGLTPERKKKLTDALSDLAYSPATGDEDPDEAKTAQDRALRRRGPRPLTATDAARIKASAVAEAQEHMRGLSRAVRDVRGLVGELDPLSFDSASDVYGYALEQSGINPREYPRQAWRGMVDVMRVKKAAALSGGMARDAAPIKMNGKFAGLNNISIAD